MDQGYFYDEIRYNSSVMERKIGTMSQNSREQELAVMIIANAGDSKSTALEAIDYAREGYFEKANELLKQAQEVLQVGHQAHTDLIVLDANERVDVSMLLVHASNHLSVAEVTVQFAEIIIGILEEKEK